MYTKFTQSTVTQPLIHVVWAQGWDVAPKKALENAKTWEDVGLVMRWSAELAVQHGLVRPELIAACRTYAGQTDLILIAAQAIMGGMAVGADARALRPERIRAEVERCYGEDPRTGFICWQAYKKRPYSGQSFFAPGHIWPQIVRAGHDREVEALGRTSRGPVGVSGPAAWIRRTREHPGLIEKTCFILQGREVLLREPRNRKRRTPGAWMDPGNYGSFNKKPKETWD